ncbi:TRAP-type C4-dicarboxylate transport system, small permease component [Salinihabitans flavidus]|uniref:TRAP transporter small permease protein n=1 Tax=Salinihabitans flavidus TaxID=569882 RepID=A0A1H8MLS3_9RHOB|nr:TRAP transporter small permease [Salinihabitans flavidus]SEO18188.1 TRAP-type C4-dicarboxylate transport system, small permease component [Salinihabitans flavidus]
MHRLFTLFDRLCLALAWLSGLIAAFVMTVTFVGVVMRYLLRKPLMGGFEMIEIGMGLIVFSALPWMVRRGANIRVTVLSDKFPTMLARLADFFSQSVGAILMAFIAWRVWLQGERLLKYNEVTMELRVPKGMIAQGMSVLLAVTALAFLLCAVEVLRRAGRGEPSAGGSR